MNGRVAIMREAIVRITKMLAEQDIQVTNRGVSAYCEYDKSGRPVRVNLPFIPDDASDALLSAIQGFLDHEVAHIFFTDYAVLKESAKKGVQQIWNSIEDTFIERKMAERFSGSGSNLSTTGSFFIEHYIEPELKKNPDKALAILMTPAVRAWAGQAVFRDYMEDKWHVLKPVSERLGSLVDKVSKCESSADCLALALEFAKALKEESKGDPGESEGESDEPSPEKGKKSKSVKSKDKGEEEKHAEESDDDGKSDDKPEPSSEGEPEEGEPADGEPEEGDSAESESDDAEGEPADGEPEEGDSAESESDDAEGEPEEGESGGDTGDGDGDSSDSKPSGEARDEEKPESEPKRSDSVSKGGIGASSVLEELEKDGAFKDYSATIAEVLTEKAVEDVGSSEYTVYTKEHDIVKVLEKPVVPDHSVRDMQDSVDKMVGPLQKDLERAIAAKSAATWSTGHRSGRLHTSALARLTSFNDERVFRRKHISTSKDVAVSLLVDCSGSMTNAGKIVVAARTAYALSAVLDRMNIAHEVLGFTTGSEYLVPKYGEKEYDLDISYSRQLNLYIPIFKGFGERMGSEPRRRIASLQGASWLSENVDGESVQIAANRLAQRKETRKILMVLSDGQPACPGDYAGLRTHLKKTVHEIEKAGIDVVAIGIKSTAPQQFYSKAVVLNDVSDLPKTVIGEVKRLLMK